MNSNTSQTKRGRKTAYLCRRKINSTSNKHQLSHSLTAVKASYKKRISALLKNNKTLANALQESRQELSDVKSRLETTNEYLNKIMFMQSKMQHMHSTLQSFMKDFNGALQLFKQAETRWPALGYIKKCRNEFKNRMQNVIEPVEEISERDSISVDPEIGKCSVEKKKSSDMIISTPVASDSKKVPTILLTELDKETIKESVSLITANEDFVNCSQEDNVPVIYEKLAKLNSPEFEDFVLKTPVLPALACGESSNGTAQPNDDEKKNCDDILPSREMEISATPKLSISCPSIKSVVNLNSSCSSTYSHPAETSVASSTVNMPSEPSRTVLSVKSKNSKIPRFQNFSANTKTRTCLFDITGQKKPSYIKNSTPKTRNFVYKSNSDVCQKIPFTDSIKVPSENTVYNLNNGCSNHEGILTDSNSEVIDAEDLHRRKTFVVQKSENVCSLESQSNRRKTFVKKTYKTNKKSSISNVNKRKTFIVTKKDNVDESDSNDENCSTIDSQSASANIIQNQNVAHLLDDSGKILSAVPVAPVLNTTVSTSSAKEFDSNIQSTEMLTDKNKISVANHFPEPQLRDEPMANIPMINCVEVLSVLCNKENGKEFDNSLQSAERLVNVCTIPAQNSIQESQDCDKNAILGSKISYSEGDLVMPTEIKCIDSPVDLNVKLDQNIFLESEINRRKENEEEVIESKEPNLQEHSASDNENLKKEFNQGNDVLECDVLSSLNLKGVMKHKQNISPNFMSSSDSEGEVISNLDFDIPLVKDFPFRKCISKSKPSKVFVFDANKRKSSFLKNRQNKLKSTKNDIKVHHEGDIPTQSSNGSVCNIKPQNIKENSASIKLQIPKKKRLTVQFAPDTYIDENNIPNTDGEACKSEFDNSAKQPKFVANRKQKAEDIRKNNKNLIADEINSNVSPLCTEVDTSSCQTNIFSSYTNRSVHDQNECIIPHNKAKSENFDAIVKIQCSDGRNEKGSKPKKSKREKQKLLNDSVSLDDCLSSKRSKISQCSDVENEKGSKPKNLKRKKQKLLSDSVSLDDCLSSKRSKIINSKRIDEDCQEITLAVTEKNGNSGSKHAKKKPKSKEKDVKMKVNEFSEKAIVCKNSKKETKSKDKKVKKKVNKFSEEDMALKNTAEIYPPPDFVNRLSFDCSSKENMEVDKMKSKRLSVVLNDVFQSKDIINLNLSCDKEYLQSKENTHLPSKTPLSENSSNVQITSVTKNVTKAANDSHCLDETKTSRRRRAPKLSYKEPSLNLKMRR